MGIGGGIFLIALGAVLAFAIRVDPWWIDINTVGVVLILAGAGVLFVTLWYWHDRRRRVIRSWVEENRLSHQRGDGGTKPPIPPDAPPPPSPSG
ncbi:DUF6458 family protein [Phytohabitans kaempferiae]|uniref:DUF6458 family protein n=1 Tax=Phytohabitans kaempferiae TaxID=1620943 RepID=A0ABV6M711_9ACTN